jgi:hypothetical protein
MEIQKRVPVLVLDGGVCFARLRATIVLRQTGFGTMQILIQAQMILADLMSWKDVDKAMANSISSWCGLMARPARPMHKSGNKHPTQQHRPAMVVIAASLVMKPSMSTTIATIGGGLSAAVCLRSWTVLSHIETGGMPLARRAHTSIVGFPGGTVLQFQP